MSHLRQYGDSGSRKSRSNWGDDSPGAAHRQSLEPAIPTQARGSPAFPTGAVPILRCPAPPALPPRRGGPETARELCENAPRRATDKQPYTGGIATVIRMTPPNTATPETHNPGEVDDFIRWAERIRRSPHTIARYRSVLGQFPDPASATREEVEAWWETREHLAPASQENELACLRTFYKWATKFDIRPDDPTRRITPPKVDNAFPRPIGRVELARAFEICDERSAADLRRALALGAYGGLRVSEAAALTWKGVDLEKRMLRFRGKGTKERLSALSPRLLDEILPDLDPEVSVVTGAKGKTYSADALQRRVNRLLGTVNEGLTFHKLRARYVTQAIADTGDIFNVAKAVGWASIETAQHYAEVSNDALHRIAAAASR